MLENMQTKILMRDIPSITDLKITELNKIEKTMQFIGRSEVDGINYTSLSKNIGITKYKAES